MQSHRIVAIALLAAVVTGVAIACSSPQGTDEPGPPGSVGPPGAQGPAGEAGPPGATSQLPPGVIVAFGGGGAPDGWLLCDGSTVSRTTYAALFAEVGVNFGEGDGTTTFNLPDLRGRFLRGVDGDAGRDPDNATRTVMNVGGSVGNAVGSVQPDAFKSHSHSLPQQEGRAASGTGFDGEMYAANSGLPAGTVDASSVGGTETRPINAYVNYIIKE